MKRSFSLTALILCSLTLCGAAVQGQTWRLTNDAYSDTLPKITIDNAGRVWVAWLSKTPGNYDVYCRRLEGSVWGDTFRLYSDSVDQYRCAVANDRTNDRVWFAWNRRVEVAQGVYRSLVHGVYSHADNMIDLGIISDTVHPYEHSSGLLLASGAAGKMYLSWTTDSNNWTSDGVIRSYSNNTWGDVQKVFAGWYGGSPTMGVINARCVDLTASGDSTVNILGQFTWSPHGGIYQVLIDNARWVADSSVWHLYCVINWAGYTNQGPNAIAAQRIGNDILTIYTMNQDWNNLSLLCKKQSTTQSFPDTVLTIIGSLVRVQAGSIDGASCPALAWSDGNSIFLNAYYDTIWSHPPARISDTSLHNCINPDIVAENDSTVWVCYQNDGEIYATVARRPLQDTIAPAAIKTLTADSSTGTSVTLRWTSVGDDSISGTAASYDVRWSTSAITPVNWNQAVKVPDVPAPRTPGTMETLTITGLSYHTTYFFAVKTIDEAFNFSGISNIASRMTLRDPTVACLDSIRPAQNAGAIEAGQAVVMWFSGPVDTATLGYHFMVGEPVAFTRQWSALDSTKTVTLSHSAGFARNSAYTIYFWWRDALSRVMTYTLQFTTNTVTQVPVSMPGFSFCPNPATTMTTISLRPDKVGGAVIEVYDVIGGRVRTICPKQETTVWDLDNDAGQKLASGVYFARLRSGGQETIRRISIVK